MWKVGELDLKFSENKTISAPASPRKTNSRTSAKTSVLKRESETIMRSEKLSKAR